MSRRRERSPASARSSPTPTCARISPATAFRLALPSAAIRFAVDPYPLAHDELTYVGEPIALVVAESRALAEDAASPHRHRCRAAPCRHRSGRGPCHPVRRVRASTAPTISSPSTSSNTAMSMTAFARAAHRIAMRFKLDKGGGHSLEAARDPRPLRSSRRHAHRLGQHPDAAPREIHPGESARPRRNADCA